MVDIILQRESASTALLFGLSDYTNSDGLNHEYIFLGLCFLTDEYLWNPMYITLER